MKLTLQKARELINDDTDGHNMTDAKKRHSFEVGRVARKIAEKCGFDGELAEILGMIHDVGDRWNGGVQHPLVGYRYIIGLGYDSIYADICLTHSFIHGDPNCTSDGLLVEGGKVKPNPILPWENKKDSDFVLNFLKTHKNTAIEDIVNLCDLMVTDKIIGLDARLIDLIAEEGAHPNTQNHIRQARELKDSIEKQMGCTIYDLFPEIIENLKQPDTYRAAFNYRPK